MPSSIYFHRAMEAIGCMTDDDPPWAEILATAKDLIGADSGTLIMNSTAGELLHVSHVGLSDSAVRDYQQHFHKVDLLADAAAKQKAGVWLDSNEVVPRQTWLQSEFHNDYLRKHSQHQLVALLIESNGTRMTGMSFQRSTIQTDARDRLGSGDIGVYIRAFQDALSKKQLTIAEDMHLLEESFGAFGEATCLASGGGTVIRMSPLCGALFDNRKGLSIRHGRLFHPNSVVCAHVLDNLGRAVQGRTRTKATVALAPGDTLSLDISPAPAKLQMVGEPLALIRLRRSTMGGELEISCLISAFGVTPAEARVLAGLAAGLTPADYAARHSVSENTVRKQIAALKDKMNCSRVVDLVRLAILAQG